MRYILTVLLLLSFSRCAFALGEPVSDETQLIGCWKQRLYQSNAIPGIGAPDFYDPESQKYRWFCFYPKGRFFVITTNKDTAMSSKDIDKYAASYPPLMSWKFLSLGVVRVEHKQDSKQNLNWLVSIAAAPTTLTDGVSVEKGDLYMGLVNQARNAYALLRILEKIE